MSELLKKYQDVVKNPPKAGDILTTIDQTPVVMEVQSEEGRPPFVFGRAYASEILGNSLGWYLRGTGDERAIGWKCVLMTKARRDAIEKCEIVDDKLMVKSLKVVRPSESGSSLLCEVHEYLPAIEEITAAVYEPVLDPDEDAS